MLLSYLTPQVLFNDEVENSKEVMGNFTPHNLETKINKVFMKEIKFIMCQNKKILAPKHVSVIDEELLNNLKGQDILNKAALILRKSVLQAEKKNCQIKYLYRILKAVNYPNWYLFYNKVKITSYEPDCSELIYMQYINLL